MDLTPYELALVFEGAQQRERGHARMVAELLATMQNLWSDQKTSAAVLMGEAPGPNEVDDIDGFAEDDVIEALQEREMEIDSSGWVDALLEDGDP